MKRLILLVFVCFALTVPATAKPIRPLYDPIEPSRESRAAIADPDVYPIETRAFKIPFLNNNVTATAVRLFVSEDRGKSWKLVGEERPNDGYFRFRTEHDGVFWFAVQATLQDGTNSPADLARLSVNLKVAVKTQ